MVGPLEQRGLHAARWYCEASVAVAASLPSFAASVSVRLCIRVQKRPRSKRVPDGLPQCWWLEKFFPYRSCYQNPCRGTCAACCLLLSAAASGVFPTWHLPRVVSLQCVHRQAVVVPRVDCPVLCVLGRRNPHKLEHWSQAHAAVLSSNVYFRGILCIHAFGGAARPTFCPRFDSHAGICSRHRKLGCSGLGSTAALADPHPFFQFVRWWAEPRLQIPRRFLPRLGPGSASLQCAPTHLFRSLPHFNSHVPQVH